MCKFIKFSDSIVNVSSIETITETYQGNILLKTKNNERIVEYHSSFDEQRDRMDYLLNKLNENV